MWTGLHADTDLNIFAGALYRAHPVMASEGNRLTSYLQTFGQRAEQHQMGQSPQSSRHRERLLSARQRSEKAGIPVRSHPYSKPTPCVANNPRTARLIIYAQHMPSYFPQLLLYCNVTQDLYGIVS